MTRLSLSFAGLLLAASPLAAAPMEIDTLICFSGNINHMEFLQTLKMLHYDIDIEDAEPLLAWFDPEWKGYITYAEFCDAIVRAPKFPPFHAKFLEEKERQGKNMPRNSSGLDCALR